MVNTLDPNPGCPGFKMLGMGALLDTEEILIVRVLLLLGTL